MHSLRCRESEAAVVGLLVSHTVILDALIINNFPALYTRRLYLN